MPTNVIEKKKREKHLVSPETGLKVEIFEKGKIKRNIILPQQVNLNTERGSHNTNRKQSPENESHGPPKDKKIKLVPLKLKVNHENVPRKLHIESG